ncbi:E3 ubiquitin-protein ligase RNF135 isoform X1 [Trachemys scripta elegans]|uniref:E3 ubiquitin-protein ligase RNF135 isoform X1 n=1 Tax=Trachemys scripta elegans TaxID=31138 RepID=UPI001553743B|nr:E3 ubiquitin-protein ligase RNF135 isoform X1 [Trachemys scripta elegans]
MSGKRIEGSSSSELTGGQFFISIKETESSRLFSLLGAMAAAANPVKNLQDEATCSLCLEYFKDPIIITKCAHSFCRACITQHCKDTGTDVRCPHCRKSFQQENLISNRQLANMVEMVQCLNRTADKQGEESKAEKYQEATLEISEVSKQIEMVQDAISSSKQANTEMNEYVSQIKGLITEDFCAMKQYLEIQERATLMVIEQEQQVAHQKIEEMISQLAAKVNTLTEIKTQLENGLQNNATEQLSDTSSKREMYIGSPVTMNKIMLDATKISVVTSAVEELKKQLETLILKKYPAQLPQEPVGLLQERSVCSASVVSASDNPEPVVSSQFSQWAVNVTFDLRRIHRNLEITSENKKVIVSRFPPPYEPTPKRFCISQVMCSQSFSEGRHYWEVSTKDSGGWAVGVADGNIGRNDQLGRTELSWCVEWTGKNKQLSAWHRNQETRLSEDRPLKVGVFLDLANKHLSFYSLTDKETLLHRFEINIRHPVYPAFWLYGLDEEGSLTINHINRD